MGFFKKGSAESGFDVEPGGYRYEHLPEPWKRQYDVIAEGICNFQRKISVAGITETKDIMRLMETVIQEQPQFFFFDPRKYRITRSGGGCCVELDYEYDKKTALQLKEKIDENVRFIFSQIIRDGMDDYDKVLAVHDYMTENVQYNFSALAVDYVYDAHTIEGSLLKRQAVCEGIAKAVFYMLRQLGIPVITVVGSSDIDETTVEHAWNIVRIDGSYYHLDVTWDLQEVNHFTSRSHMYLNLDDDSMLMNHDWELESYPGCDSHQANYYVKEKHFFRTMRSFELYVRKFMETSGTYMDVRFEDTMEIPDDGGKYLASVIGKNAAYLGKGYQISYIFNACTYVFQANLLFQ